MNGENLGQIYAEAVLDVAKLKKGKAEVETTLKQMGVDVNKAEAAFNSLSASIGTALSVGITLPLTLFARQSVKVFAGFEQSLANVASVSGATASEFANLRKAAEEAGASTRFTASQAADALYYLSSAGLDASQSVAALNGVLELAGATASDLSFTAETVTATMSQFNLDASDSGRVSNVFAAAISKSQATMNKLADSMRYVGPVASGFGKSMEETTAALMALYNAGFKGEQAGTILRKAFSDLANPVGSATEIIEQYGLSLDRLSPEMNNFADIIDYLAEKGITSADALKLFGAEAGPGMITLLRGGGEALREYQDAITDTSAAAEMYATQNDTLAGDWDMMKSALEGLMILLVESFEPSLRRLVGSLTNAINTVSALPEPVRILGTVIAGLAAGIGPIMVLVGGFKALQSAIGTTSAVMGANPILLAAMVATGAVIGLVALIDSANKKAERLAAESQAQFDKLVNGFDDSRRKANELATSIEGLSSKTNLTASEQLKLRKLTDELTKQFPELTAEAIKQAAAMGTLAEAVDEVVKKRQLEEAINRRQPIQRDLLKNQENLDATHLKMEQARKELFALRERWQREEANSGPVPEFVAIERNAILARSQEEIDGYMQVIRNLQSSRAALERERDIIDKVIADAQAPKPLSEVTKTDSVNTTTLSTPDIIKQTGEQRLKELDDQYKREMDYAQRTGGDVTKVEAEWLKKRLDLFNTFAHENAIANGKSIEWSLNATLQGYGKMGDLVKAAQTRLRELGAEPVEAIFDSHMEAFTKGREALSQAYKNGVLDSDQLEDGVQRIRKTFLDAVGELPLDIIAREKVEEFERILEDFKLASEPIITPEMIFAGMVEEQQAIQRELKKTTAVLALAKETLAKAEKSGDSSTAKMYENLIAQLEAQVEMLKKQLGQGKTETKAFNFNEANAYVGLTKGISLATINGFKNGIDSIDWDSELAAVAPALGGIVGGLTGGEAGAALGESIGGLVGGAISAAGAIWDAITTPSESFYENAKSIGTKTGAQVVQEFLDEYERSLPDELKEASAGLVSSITSGFASGNWSDLAKTIDNNIRGMVVEKILASGGMASQIEAMMQNMFGGMGKSGHEQRAAKQAQADALKQQMDSNRNAYETYLNYQKEIEAAQKKKSNLFFLDFIGHAAADKEIAELKRIQMQFQAGFNAFQSFAAQVKKAEAEIAAIDPSFTPDIDWSNIKPEQIKDLVDKFGDDIRPILEGLGLANEEMQAVADSFVSGLDGALFDAVEKNDFDAFQAGLRDSLKKALVENMKMTTWYKDRMDLIAQAYRESMMDGVLTPDEIKQIRDSYKGLFDEVSSALDFSGLDEVFAGLDGGEVTVQQEVKGVQLTRLTGSDRDYFAELFQSFATSIEEVMASKDFVGYMDFATAAVNQITATQIIINSVTVHNEVVNITAADGASLRDVIADMIAGG